MATVIDFAYNARTLISYEALRDLTDDEIERLEAGDMRLMEELVEAEVLSEFDDEDITLDSCFDQDKDPEIVFITIN